MIYDLEVIHMLRRISTSQVLLAILMIVMGVILIVWPSPVLSVVISMLAVALILGGAISVIGWFRSGERNVVSYSRLGSGLIAVIAGILIFSQPLQVASLFPILIGMIILVTGIINVFQTLELKRAGYPRWLALLILAFITIICGIVFITQPISALEIPVIAAGIILVYDGVASLWIATRHVI